MQHCRRGREGVGGHKKSETASSGTYKVSVNYNSCIFIVSAGREKN